MLLFSGDPHGDFKPLIREALKLKPAAVITLGDHDLQRPLTTELQPVIDAGIRVYWIAGNHDGDRDHWHTNLFAGISGLWNLHGRMVDICGFRVAGLGGVFREKVWYPGKGDPKFKTRAHMLYCTPNKGHQGKWCGPGELEPGLPRKHRVTIFPEDFTQLEKLRADILICHEAPSSHRHGFADIDNLAKSMGVKLIVHGHHHHDYEATLENGIRVMGVGLAKTKVFQTDSKCFLKASDRPLT